MKNFHSVNLPSFIALNAKGSTTFATTVATTASGRETRLSERIYALQKYTISDCRLSISQFNEFNGFFRARKGQQHSFHMRDYADCIISDQILERSSNELYFEVFKTYPDQLKAYNRRITKLTPASVQLKTGDLDVRAANIDHEQGLLVLDQPLQQGQSLYVNAIFDVEVRFASDNFRYSIHPDGSIIIDDLEIIEVV